MGYGIFAKVKIPPEKTLDITGVINNAPQYGHVLTPEVTVSGTPGRGDCAILDGAAYFVNSCFGNVDIKMTEKRLNIPGKKTRRVTTTNQILAGNQLFLYDGPGFFGVNGIDDLTRNKKATN